MASRKSKRSASRAVKPRKTAARTKARAAKSATPKRAKRSNPETLRLRTFMPGFTVNDLERSISFYTDVLGFVVGERWTSDSGAATGAMLKAGACELGLSQDDWAKGRDRTKGLGLRIWAQTVQDIDALARRIKGAGWTLAEEPHDQPWGGRALSLDDPDGYHLTVFRQA
jgi:uncharacterized glyoxalase superfamily protein PhnB